MNLAQMKLHVLVVNAVPIVAALSVPPAAAVAANAVAFVILKYCPALESDKLQITCDVVLTGNTQIPTVIG